MSLAKIKIGDNVLTEFEVATLFLAASSFYADLDILLIRKNLPKNLMDINEQYLKTISKILSLIRDEK